MTYNLPVVEREQLKVDVLFVGAGPACLAGALHLSNLIRGYNEAVSSGRKEGPKLKKPTLLVVEKGRDIGSHILSGAVVDPRAFDELLAPFPDSQPPYDCPVSEDALYLLTRTRAIRSPVTPPPLNNQGYYVASLGKLVKWLAGLCEENGVEVYPGFPAVKLLFEGDRVVGARIGDKGRNSAGEPKPNFQPGIDVRARVTVLGEGARGTLAGQAFERLGLRKESQPQIYAVGVKEIWEVPGPLEPGLVYHTFGYPLGLSEFGGAFIYTMKKNLVDLGFVTGLDYKDPGLDPHAVFQRFKTHPFVRGLLEGGKAISYGAKAIPEGGYYSLSGLSADGLLIVGDSAGFLNSQRLKGIHLAVKSGMMAAESILGALASADTSSGALSSYRTSFEASWARDELWKVRNFRQSFQRGTMRGIVHALLQYVTGGRGLYDPFPAVRGHSLMQRLEEFQPDDQQQQPPFDGKLTFDKLSDVFLSDTAHEEDQPCHLKIQDLDICHNRCSVEYGNPCRHFCPADVYEMVPAESGKRLQINFTNCVHCKTCDIMDPYQIILWTPPEGGSGPDYKGM